MEPINLESFIAFCRTLVGKELETAGGKSKFILRDITDRAFYYQLSTDNVRKQNLRYVQRLLEQYTKLQSLNPGHYTNITQNASYQLALIQLYLQS